MNTSQLEINYLKADIISGYRFMWLLGYQNAKTSKKITFISLLAVFLILFGFISWYISLGLILILVFMICFHYLVFPYDIYRKNVELFSEKLTIELNETGLSIAGKNYKQDVSWESYTDIIFDHKLYILTKNAKPTVLPNPDFIIIPERCIEKNIKVKTLLNKQLITNSRHKTK